MNIEDIPEGYVKTKVAILKPKDAREGPRLCAWLRAHSHSTKPEKRRRVVIGGIVYWELTNGQLVHERTARKMGL